MDISPAALFRLGQPLLRSIQFSSFGFSFSCCCCLKVLQSTVLLLSFVSGIEKNIVVKFSFLFLSVFHAKDVSSSLKKRSQPRTDSTRSESRSQSYPSHLPILTPSGLKSPCPPAATSQPLRVMGGMCQKLSEEDWAPAGNLY